MTSTDCPQILDSKEIFHGRVFDVTVDTIREADKTYQRETVHHPGSAVIVPVFEDGTLALVRQYRHPAVVTPGFCEEKMWVYLATDLTETTQQLEDDEIIEVVRIPFSQALSMITTGEIQDAKTIIGVMLAAPRVGPPMFEAGYPAV